MAKKLAHEKASNNEVQGNTKEGSFNHIAWVYLAWSTVGIPLAWGVYRTAKSVAKFF